MRRKRPARAGLRWLGGAALAVALALPLGAFLAGSAPVVATPLTAGWAAQVNRDPLTAEEADELRDTAADPDKRVKLLLSFAADRLARFEQARAGAMPDRQPVMYRLLREYGAIIGELDDNLDEWMSGRVTGEMQAKPKLEKPLQQVVAAEQGFVATLAKIQSASSPADLATYHFELSDVVDDTNQSLQGVHDDLATLQKRKQEEEAAKKSKKKKS